LNQTGLSLRQQAQYNDALEQYQQANLCYQEMGDEAGQLKTLQNITVRSFIFFGKSQIDVTV
jgi:hypothetical protein